MLAPDGRCKALDAAADGYVRAEAAAMILLGVGGTEGSAVAVLAGMSGYFLQSTGPRPEMYCDAKKGRG
jgi:hypothetical protein